MERKPENPLSGCFLLAGGSLVLIIVLLLVVKSCCSNFINVGLLIKRLAGVFTSILVLSVLLMLFSSRRK